MSDLQTALALLPHGPEFRFIDRLLDLTPGQNGVGEYLVRTDDLFLKGHFPGAPLFPGVLLIEGAAQLSGIVAQSDPAIPPLPNLKLASLKQVKILGSAHPGELIRFQARVTGRMGKLVQTEAQAFLQDILILSAEIALASGGG